LRAQGWRRVTVAGRLASDLLLAREDALDVFGDCAAAVGELAAVRGLLLKREEQLALLTRAMTEAAGNLALSVEGEGKASAAPQGVN
jgi:hypothetical protein